MSGEETNEGVKKGIKQRDPSGLGIAEGIFL